MEIITFVTGAILLLHGFFSYLFSWPIPIASASAAALIISVLFINSAILHVPRPLRLMFRYFYIMLAIALVWFVATMNHVVTMFVIPITCLVSLVFDVVLLIVLRAKAIDEIRQVSGVRHRRWSDASDVHSARLGSVGCTGDGQRAGLPAGAARPARLRPPSALLGIRQTVLGLIASCAQSPDLGWKP